MNFAKAVDALIHGEKVKRENWPSSIRINRVDNQDVFEFSGMDSRRLDRTIMLIVEDVKADDWAIVIEPKDDERCNELSFAAAFARVLEGHIAFRGGWDKTSQWIWLGNVLYDSLGKDKKIVCIATPDGPQVWSPSQADMTAKDWSVPPLRGKR